MGPNAGLVLTMLLALGPEEALAECDRLAFEVPEAERDYQCWGRVAREHDHGPVLEHIEALTADHPEDCRLWLALGAMRANYAEDPHEALRTAIKLCGEQDQPGYQIQAQLNLAHRLDADGDEDGALTLFRDAKKVAATFDNPVFTALTTFELAGAIASRGDDDLLEAYEDAREAYETMPDEVPYPVRRNGAHMLARISRSLGRSRAAATWSEESARVAIEAGDLHSALHPRRAAANDWLDVAVEQYDPQAVSRFREQMKAVKADAIEHRNPYAQLSATQHLARTAPRKDAEEAYQACVALARELEADPMAAECEMGVAEAMAEREPERARAIADRLIEGLGEDALAWERADLLLGQGRLRWSTGDLEGAWQAWLAMLDASEAMVASQDTSESRQLVHARAINRYRLTAGGLLESAGDDSTWQSRAFSVMERMRGREAMEFRRRAGIETGATDDATSPSAPFATLEEIQDELDPGQAMLVYQLGFATDLGWRTMGGSWVVVITRDGAQAVGLDPVEVLEPAILMAVDGLTGPPSPSQEVMLASLHERLIAPALATLPADIERLVVVPDGQLHRLPFAALGPQDGLAVVERFALTTAVSATSWREQSRGGPVSRKLLALADPTPLEATSPDTAPAESAALADASWRAALPGARSEAAYAVELVGDASELRVGDEATKAALADGTEFSIVHLAAHAVVDPSDPKATRLVLSASGDEDGLVGLDELAAGDFSGSLVVLAACQGADGELLAGEGLISLARALFMAGSRTVVAGLWAVPDDQAAALFAEFYRALDEGATASEALAEAQRARRAAGAPRSAWAGFVVYGDGDLRLVEKPRKPVVWWLLLAATLGGGLGWALTSIGPKKGRAKKSARKKSSTP